MKFVEKKSHKVGIHFVLERSLNAVQEAVTWDDVEKVYNEAMNDFEELERAKATGPFGMPISTVKQTFEERFGYALKHRLGRPEILAKEIAEHAHDALLMYAGATAEKEVIKEIMKETGKNCFVDGTWDSSKGVCTLYKFDPLKLPSEKGKIIEKEEVSCPYNESEGMEAEHIMITEMGNRGWFDECLFQVLPNVVSDVEYLGENNVEFRSTWNLESEAKKWYEEWEKKWKELEAKYS
jgi:hypothetical protein